MKTWIVTGCSSGLGRALAETLLEKGYNVAVTARKPETVADLAEKYPETAIALALDVTDHDSVVKAVADTKARFGSIDVLANNAGYCLRGAVEECSMEAVQKQFATNFYGPLDLIQTVLPVMREQKSGVIVNYSSIAALNTSEGSAFYGASKAALEAMSDGLRKEVDPLGIRVIVVEPGPFATDFYDCSLDISDTNIGDYADTAAKRKGRNPHPGQGLPGWGSPRLAAETVITASEEEQPPFRLLLGRVAIGSAEKRIADTQKEIETWRELILHSDGEDS